MKTAPYFCWMLCLGMLLYAGGAGAGDEVVQEQWYPITVNHYEGRYHALIIDHPEAGRAIRRLDLLMLGLPVPDGTLIRHQSEWFHPITVLEDYHISVDEIAGRVHFSKRGKDHMKAPASRDLLLSVTLNGQPLDQTQHLVFDQGELMLPVKAQKALGLSRVRDEPLPLHDIAGEHFTFNPRELTLELTVPATALQDNIVTVDGDGRSSASQPEEQWSALMDYRVTRRHDSTHGGQHAVMADGAISKGATLCESSHLYRSSTSHARRLESRCVFDFPEDMLSLNVGDGVSRTDALSQPVRYGGVRFGTDFALAPEFITQPSLTLDDSARVPSILEVWVDQRRALRQSLRPGPFQINDIPTHTGAGEIRAQIEDGSGNVRTITRPFYSDPSLLAPGLTEWALEFGRKRYSAIGRDPEYREGLGVFNARHGLDDWLTLGLHAETQSAVDMVSASGHIRVGQLGVLELGAAGSRLANGRMGRSRLMGFSHKSSHFSLGLRQETTGEDFARLGDEMPGSAPARTRRATLGLPLTSAISINLGHASRRFRDESAPEQQFHTGSVNLRLPGRSSLRLGVMDTTEPVAETRYSLQLTIPLGQRSTLSSSASGVDETNHQVQLQKNAPAGPGIGYRASAGRFNDQPTEAADFTARTRLAELQLRGRRAGDQGTALAELSGSAVAAGGDVFLSRSRPGSLALVDVSAPDVRVYSDNRVMGTTGDNGKLVVPGLRPYQQNRLRVAVEDLPLDMRLDDDNTTVVPGRRQAVNADFNGIRERHVRARLLQPNGEVVPAGARVQLEGGEKTTVGRQGLLYLQMDDRERLQARINWHNRQCRLSEALPDGDEVIMDMETLVCESD